MNTKNNIIYIQDSNKLLSFFLEITGNNEKDIYYIKNLIEIYPNILTYMLNNEMPDLSMVKYVKEKRYKQLMQKVLTHYNLLQLNYKLNDLFPLSLLKTIKNHYSAKIEDDNILINYIAKQMHINPYDFLCSITGIGFIKADNILIAANSHENSLWTYDLKSSVQRCTSFILWYLINNLNGSTYIEISKIKNIMMYKYNLQDCLISFEKAILDKRITIFEDNKLVLTNTYIEESNIANYVSEAIKNENQKCFNINTNEYRENNNFTLTDDQIKTLELINKHQLVLLNGYAGTGKSSSIKALINMLEDNNKSYVIISPTAKAAKQISLYTQRPASTIHYLLCKDFPDFDHNISEKTEYEIASNLLNDSKGYDTLDYDVIIIDETSMLSVTLFNLLLKYIDCKKTKVLLIGDSYQLPSIQNGNLYQDLLEIDDIPKVTLEKIFRYTENGLVQVASNIRLGKRYLNDNDIQCIGDSYEFYQFDDIPKMINAALNKYMELLKEGNEIQDIAILTAKNVGNSGTNLINSCVQRIINPIDEFDDYISIQVDNQVIRFKENDIVMNIKNNYNAYPINGDKKLLIANGQIGKIKSVNSFDNSIILEIDDNIYKFEYSDIKNLRLAYCFTIHKSQGSQFKNVIYLVSPEDMFMTTSNLMYVAITRAQDKCYQFGAKHVINYKINERENLKRNTTLIKNYEYINKK